MFKTKIINVLIIYTFAVLVSSSIVYFSGCSNTETPPPPPTTDPNVIIYDSLTIYEFQHDYSLSAVNLYTGKVVQDSDRTKDMVMRDLNSADTFFFFRSGDQSFFNLKGHPVPFHVDTAGYTCYFQSHSSILTPTQFDTLSKIWGVPDSALTSYFTIPAVTDTRQWGYFNASLNQGFVYEFYLKGKLDNGTTQHQVFGLIYLISGSGGNGQLNYKQIIKVKINTGGKNHFVK